MRIKRLLTGVIKIITLSFVSLTFVNGLVSASENITTSVGVQSSLTLTMPTTALSLNLDPSSTTFGYKDLPISVGTNNETGFTMTVSTANDNTNLVNTADSNTVIETLPPSSPTTTGYTDADFIVNKWGYKNGLSNNYFPFQSGATVLENDTPTNEKSTTLRFATKIDYMQPEGTYSTTFNFSLVANPVVQYMQDITPAICESLAFADNYTVVDKRDDKEYTARWINGSCWMTQNLRFIGSPTDPTGTMTIDPSSTNTDVAKTISYTDSLSPNTYDDAKLRDSNNTTTGVWYNYALASAMTIRGSSNSNPQVYDICPSGWRIPTQTEVQTLFGHSSEFGPITGGRYYGGAYQDASGGYWWTSTATSTTYRDYIYYESSTLADRGGARYASQWLRCVLNDTRAISDITYMQDINKQIVANTANGATKTLIDSRDGQEYTVAKINGNLWMTRNLAIGCDGTGDTYGTNYANPARILTSADSNVLNNFTTPTTAISANGGSYTDPRMNCSDTYGAWYNYATTTAGTITGSGNNNKALYSVCPAGWRLPTNTEDGTVLSYVTEFKPISGGIIWADGSSSPTNLGYFWTSINATTNRRYYFYYNESNNTLNAANTGVPNNGFYIRCIADY